MQNENFKKLVAILKEEIKFYTYMRNLYTKKKEVLVTNQLEMLATVDTKIVETYETIKKLDIERVEITNSISTEANSMTELIEIAKESCPKVVSTLKEQQARLEHLSSAISLLNLTNMKLINHGMVLTDKKLNMIIEACAPKGTSYSEKGVENQDMELSTIVKDV